MADAMTTTGSLGTDTAAYEMFGYHALRPLLTFDAVADVKPTAQSHPGSSVAFTIFSDLTVISSAISESVDIDAVAMADSQVTVTLAEYGNAVNSTFKMRATSYIPLNPAAVNVIAFNAGNSINTIVRDVLKGGSNVRYSGAATARNTVIPTDKLVLANVRRAVADLRGAKAMTATNGGGSFAGFIHPDVSYDLRGETGEAGWLAPQVYSAPENVWNGEVGKIVGVRFVETSEAPVFADAGSSTTLTDVYATLILGGQALAKAYSSEEGRGPLPRVGFGPVVDKLERFVPVTWHWFGGYARFREASLRRIESASTIGANA